MAGENGLIELGQFGLALFAAIGLFAAAVITRRGTAGLVACGALVAYAAACESDFWFEAVFFDDAYKYLVGLPMAFLVVGIGWIKRQSLVRDCFFTYRLFGYRSSRVR